MCYFQCFLIWRKIFVDIVRFTVEGQDCISKKSGKAFKCRKGRLMFQLFQFLDDSMKNYKIERPNQISDFCKWNSLNWFGEWLLIWQMSRIVNRTAQVQDIFIVLNHCTVFTLTYGLGGSQIYSQLPEYHLCCGAVDCIFTCGIWIQYVLFPVSHRCCLIVRLLSYRAQQVWSVIW